MKYCSFTVSFARLWSNKLLVMRAEKPRSGSRTRAIFGRGANLGQGNGYERSGSHALLADNLYPDSQHPDDPTPRPCHPRAVPLNPKP